MRSRCIMAPSPQAHIRRALLATIVAGIALLSLCISPSASHAANQPYVHISTTNQFGQPAAWAELKSDTGNIMLSAAGDGSFTTQRDAGSSFSYTATGGWLPNSEMPTASDCTSEALSKWPAATVSGTVSADETRNNFTLRLNPIVRELTSPSVSPEEQKMVDLVNQWRASIGARQLVLFDRVSGAADAQATALATTPGLDRHMGPACAQFPAVYGELGGRLDDASDDLGDVVTYQATDTRTYTAAEAFKSFMDSKSGHAQALANPRAQAVGVAMVDNAWVVQLIGKNGLKSSDYTSERLNYTPDLSSLKRVSACKWCSGGPGDNTDPSGDDSQDERTTQQLTVNKPTKQFKAGAKVTLKGRAQAGQHIKLRYGKKTATTTASSANRWSRQIKLPRHIKGETIKVTVTDGNSTVKAALRIKRG